MKLNSLINRILDSFGAFKKVSDGGLVGQDSAQNSEDIERCSSKLTVVLDDGHEAVCDDCNIYLYSHSVLAGSPKGEHAKMLFYPPEEQFHLPSLLVEHCNILSLDRKVIRKECERPLQFRSIVNYPPQLRWVLGLCQLSSQSYGLIKQHIVVPIQQFISSHNFVLEMILRSDDEHRADALNPVQSGKVVISFVKDIERIRLIWYLIHCLHIVKFCFRNVNVCRNLSDYIKQCMHFDSALGLSEVCPLEKTHTKVYRRRIKRIELSVEFKRSCDSLALSKVNHIVGKLLKDLVISVGVSIRQIAKLYVSATETEMVALILDGINDRSDLPEAVTARKLSEHHNKKLIPTGEMLHPLITFVSFYNAIKDSFRKKTDELTEYVFACIHTCPILMSAANMRNQFKSTRDVFCYI